MSIVSISLLELNYYKLKNANKTLFFPVAFFCDDIRLNSTKLKMHSFMGATKTRDRPEPIGPGTGF